MNRPRRIHSKVAKAAAAVAMGMAAQAGAAVLYVSDESTGVIYDFPNAGNYISGAPVITATTGANGFQTLSNVLGITADTSGDVIGVQYNSTSGTAHAYNSQGTPIGTVSGAFGNNNYNSLLYGSTLYTESESTLATNAATTALAYNYNSGSPTFSAAVTLTAATGRVSYGLTAIPSGSGPSNNSDAYLVVSEGAAGTGYGIFQAYDLTTGANAGVLSGLGYTISTAAQFQGVAFDPANGDIYATAIGASVPRLYQLAPTYNAGGTLTNFSATAVALTGYSISTPTDLTFGPDGNLYVVDEAGYVEEVTLSSGGLTGVASEYISLGGATGASGLVFVVPEPASVALLALGACPVLLGRRRRRRCGAVPAG